jgi:hypothetical protein
MGRRRYCLGLIFPWLFCCSILGQSYSFNILYAPTKFIKHAKKSTFEAPAYSQLWQSSLNFHLNGSKHWQRYWNRPTIELNMLYMHFGNDDILGKAFGCIPSVRFKLTKVKTIDINFHVGFGGAYLNKKYDKISNPLNNAIGSHWNNVTQFALSIERQVYKNFHIAVGGHFTHFSNARTASPNRGINTAGLTFGVIQSFEGKSDKREENKFLSDTLEKSGDTVILKRRWGGDFLAGYGISEYSFTGGPKYGSYFMNVGLSYSISPFLKIILGGEYEYNQSVYQFYYQDFIPADEAKQKATKIASYLAADLAFGKVVFRAQSGYYLPYPELRENTTPYYIKLNINVYPFPDHWRLRPYLGILLKSHVEIAQYMGLVSGVSF